jgi:hypothetical protein
MHLNYQNILHRLTPDTPPQIIAERNTYTYLEKLEIDLKQCIQTCKIR